VTGATAVLDTMDQRSRSLVRPLKWPPGSGIMGWSEKRISWAARQPHFHQEIGGRGSGVHGSAPLFDFVEHLQPQCHGQVVPALIR
jgi:hypothetical protein